MYNENIQYHISSGNFKKGKKTDEKLGFLLISLVL